MKSSINFSQMKLQLPPYLFLLCLVVAVLMLFFAGRFAYAQVTNSLTLVVDAQIQPALRTEQLDSLDRFQKRLDPANRSKWESRARSLPPESEISTEPAP